MSKDIYGESGVILKIQQNGNRKSATVYKFDEF